MADTSIKGKDNMKLTLITPTRCRPKAFSFLEGYIRRQTFFEAGGSVQWIVVNDSPTGRDQYSYTMGQQVIDRDASKDAGRHSLVCNYEAALPHIQHEHILFIEDDDYYAPTYLSIMWYALEKSPLAGVCPSWYYHVAGRRWRSLRNYENAALACTGITAEVLPVFKQALAIPGIVFLDSWLWAHWAGTLGMDREIVTNCYRVQGQPLQVGIKGLTHGIRGVGIGHQATIGYPDPDFQKLKTWLPDDWRNYT